MRLLRLRSLLSHSCEFHTKFHCPRASLQSECLIRRLGFFVVVVGLIPISLAMLHSVIGSKFVGETADIINAPLVSVVIATARFRVLLHRVKE
jgi:hypothetical protein